MNDYKWDWLFLGLARPTILRLSLLSLSLVGNSNFQRLSHSTKHDIDVPRRKGFCQVRRNLYGLVTSMANRQNVELMSGWRKGRVSCDYRTNRRRIEYMLNNHTRKGASGNLTLLQFVRFCRFQERRYALVYERTNGRFDNIYWVYSHRLSNAANI